MNVKKSFFNPKEAFICSPYDKKDHKSGLCQFLRSQNFSAFLATSSQDFASVLRTHALAETVHLLALANIRSECRSHVFAPP